MSVRVKVRKVLKIWVPITLLVSGLFVAYLWIEGMTIAGFFGRIIYDDVPRSSFSTTLVQNKKIIIPIRIFERRLYLLELKLSHNSELERTIIETIIGSGYSTGKERGIPLTFNIILKTKSEDIIYNNIEISYGANGFNKYYRFRTISGFDLDSGIYILEITPLDNNAILSIFNIFKPDIEIAYNPKTTLPPKEP